MAEEQGVWRTVRGRRIFIRDGESLDSAMQRSGKFENANGNKNDVSSYTEKLKNIDINKLDKDIGLNKITSRISGNFIHPEDKDFKAGFNKAMEATKSDIKDWQKINSKIYHNLDANIKDTARRQYLSRRSPSEAERSENRYFEGFRVGYFLTDKLRDELYFDSKDNTLTNYLKKLK